MTEADIQNLQSVGKDARIARQQFILKDDEEVVWNHIQTLKDGQADFILDNCEWWRYLFHPSFNRRLIMYCVARPPAGFEVYFYHL